MKRIFAYIVFGATFLASGLMLAALHDWLNAPSGFVWLIPIVAALVAVILGHRVHPLSPWGLLLTTVICVLLAHTLIVAIHQRLAVPAGGSVGFVDLYRIGGARLAFTVILELAAPLAWHYLLYGRQPKYVPQRQS